MGGLRPPKGAAPAGLSGYPENVARALGVCQGHGSLPYRAAKSKGMRAAARHVGGFPGPTPLFCALPKAQPPPGPGQGPAPCHTQHLHLTSWPSTDPREQGPSARPSPHPESHGPSSAYPQRPASLFHFCKLGVGATDRMEEGCSPLHLRFRKFLAPPSSLRGTQRVFLSSPTFPLPHSVE